MLMLPHTHTHIYIYIYIYIYIILKYTINIIKMASYKAQYSKLINNYEKITWKSSLKPNSKMTLKTDFKIQFFTMQEVLLRFHDHQALYLRFHLYSLSLNETIFLSPPFFTVSLFHLSEQYICFFFSFSFFSPFFLLFFSLMRRGIMDIYFYAYTWKRFPFFSFYLQTIFIS